MNNKIIAYRRPYQSLTPAEALIDKSRRIIWIVKRHDTHYWGSVVQISLRSEVPVLESLFKIIHPTEQDIMNVYSLLYIPPRAFKADLERSYRHRALYHIDHHIKIIQLGLFVKMLSSPDIPISYKHSNELLWDIIFQTHSYDAPCFQKAHKLLIQFAEEVRQHIGG